MLVKIYNGNHDTSTPPRSKTNGVAERAVPRLKEGAAIALVQKRTTRRNVGLCDGMLVLFAQRARHDGPWRDSVRVEKWWTINSIRNIGRVHPQYREGQVKNPAVRKENAERNILRVRARCG